MRKAYIQPEAELLSLALLEDFLTSSPGSDDNITNEDVTVPGGSGADDNFTSGEGNNNTGGSIPGNDEYGQDGKWN